MENKFNFLSFIVKDGNNNKIFEKHFQNEITGDKILAISSFVEGLNTFSNEEFKGNLNRVEFENIWLDFMWLKDYSVIMISHIKELSSDEDINLFDNCIGYIKEIAEKFLTLGNKSIESKYLEILSSQLDMNVSILNSNNSIFSKSITSLEDMEKQTNTLGDTHAEVKMTVVCESSAVPIHYKTYGDKEIRDPILITSILSAISTFARFELNLELKSIFMGQHRLLFNWKSDRMYIIAVNCRTPEISNRFPMKYRLGFKRLLNAMGETMDMVFQEDDEVSTDILDEIMDTYVLETVNV